MTTYHDRPAAPTGRYSDDHAADYDRWFAKPGVTAATVDSLALLAGEGRVLELGVGTGRIALPLARRGFDVHGVEASQSMADRLRAKPGGESVRVTLGDFAEVPVEGVFSLVLVVGGTLFELPSHQDIQRCLTAAAEHLEAEGVLVLDAHVPEALAVAAASGVPEVVSESEDHLILCHRRIDPSTATYHSHYLVHEADRTHHLRVRFHYASPRELDLMAQRAGLRLRTRLGSWAGGPFTRDSAYHVSVYERR
ncbi:methyltransferase [Streptomyces subrutilus]|uniref:Methyltransferase n=1 Tax=Streptomyces subrutilus TaxID=36818 RepID=A0A5P2UI29_9ACTN|nr:class I SAM-dependent methyltransferase [Streptomyces subrutilus]QEU77114.1 class I SAM-dependent methyltransferase [Streptomyces subrutilus]GGZ86686.1 methyltransferase [Streptomyces subrutilus]